MKNVIIFVVLAALLVGGVVVGFSYSDRYADLHREYGAAVSSAQAELNAVIAERNGVSPLDSSDELQRIAAEQELLVEAEEEIARLTEENAAIDAAIVQAQADLAEAQQGEEYAYYKAAYDSMAEGRALVESYLEDN